MKNLLLAAVLGLSILPLASHADESIMEKAEAEANNLNRAATKQVHRAEEATCTKNDVECLAKEAENRVKEAASATEDKAKELKNDVD